MQGTNKLNEVNLLLSKEQFAHIRRALVHYDLGGKVPQHEAFMHTQLRANFANIAEVKSCDDLGESFRNARMR